MRLFVMTNTPRTFHHAIVRLGNSNFCRVRGEDDELELSDQLERVCQDRRLCGARARRRRGSAHRKSVSTAASKSSQQVPESPLRVERAYVADDRPLKQRLGLKAWKPHAVCG